LLLTDWPAIGIMASMQRENPSAQAWSPGEAGLKVRLRDNPGRQGTTTGRTRMAGSFLLVEVDFGPNEKQYKVIS
jgi:hypothetical protein